MFEREILDLFMNVKKLFKEPLLHFLVVGAVIFAVDQWREGHRPQEDAPNRIDVTAGTVAWLRESFTRQWKRAPDEAQLRSLVDDHLREEVLYREALALGLERDDSIVRRRMAQKMEFLTQDISSAVAPDEAQQRAFFAANEQRYAKPARVSFRHVFFSKDRRGTNLDADTKAALLALASGTDDGEMGDPFLREREFSKAESADIIAALGPEFATRLQTLPVGAWQGPIESTYGIHLVIVSERIPAPPTPFEAMRDAVTRDLLDERRVTVNRDLVQRLKARYRITIDEAAITGAAALPAVISTAAHTAPPAPNTGNAQ